MNTFLDIKNLEEIDKLRSDLEGIADIIAEFLAAQANNDHQKMSECNFQLINPLNCLRESHSCHFGIYQETRRIDTEGKEHNFRCRLKDKFNYGNTYCALLNIFLVRDQRIHSPITVKEKTEVEIDSHTSQCMDPFLEETFGELMKEEQYH